MVRQTIVNVFVIVAILAIVAVVLMPVFTEVGKRSGRMPCISNLKQIARSTILYAEDHNERLPHRDAWIDSIEDYAKSDGLFHCPGAQTAKPQNPSIYGYAFHSRLSNVNQTKVEKPEKTPLLYDSVNLARNASDPYSSLPVPPRNHGGHTMNMVAYADSHVKALPKEGKQ